MSKVLITSGCSFTDNVETRWPHYLAENLGARLVNYGYGSSGNDHICNSTIFALQKEFERGTRAEDITVVVMWSGPSRQGHFVSLEEMPMFVELHNPAHLNPVNFVEFVEQSPGTGRMIPNTETYRKGRAGWLLGSPSCTWENPEIGALKKLYFENFFTIEESWFKSLNYFLQLQWFCETRGVYLRNLTFKNIWENPLRWNTCTHLQQMLNMSKWIFWKERDGLYEYTRDNRLGMYHDKFHPLPASHKHFAINYLIPRL
jgi:hypothetical protein